MRAGRFTVFTAKSPVTTPQNPRDNQTEIFRNIYVGKPRRVLPASSIGPRRPHHTLSMHLCGPAPNGSVSHVPASAREGFALGPPLRLVLLACSYDVFVVLAGDHV
jgi:hypothetical protein